MAISIPDQGSVDLGRSRISPADTYSGAPNPGRGGGGGGLDELSAALAKMGVVVQDEEAKRKALREEEAARNVNNAVNGIEVDDRLAIADRAALGKALPGASPKTLMVATELAGARYVEKQLDQEWSALLADQSLLSNPQLLDEKMKEARKRYTDLLAQNPDPLFRNGGLGYFNKWEDSVRQSGRALSVDEMMKGNLQSFSTENKGTVGLVAAQSTAQRAAARVGVDPKFIVPFLSKENAKGDPNAMNEAGSTAGGLFQITDGTWTYLVDKYGKQFGITRDMKFNPDANATMAALYAKENIETLTKSLGRNITPGEAYMAHLFGPVRAVSFINAAKDNPGKNPVEFFGKEIVELNPSIFYKDPRNKQGLMSLREVYEKNKGDIEKNDFYSVPNTRFDGKPKVMFTRDTFASKHYGWNDFKNNGEYGADGTLDSRTVNLLDTVTDQFGKKLTITSAFRDSNYNNKVSFSGKSGPHTSGNAIDIDVKNLSDDEKKRLISLFVANGAKGIGHYSNGSIHVDLRDTPGKESDGLALWYDRNTPYTSGKQWFIDGVAQGREWRGQGSVPAPGFNGMPMNPYEARIRQAQAMGIRPSVAREQLMKDILASATSTQDFASGRAVLDDFSKNMRLTPTESALIAKAKEEIQKNEVEQYTLRRKMQKDMEEEQLERVLKPQIIREKAESTQPGGKPFNPLKYLENPKAYEYAKQVMNDEFVDPGVSSTAKLETSDRVIKSATVGDFSWMGVTNGAIPTVAQAARYIDSRTDMTIADKTKLKEELPKLMAGVNLIRDPDVRTFFDVNIGSTVDAMKKAEALPGSTVANLMGVDLRGEAFKVFMDNYQRGVRHHIATTDRIPTSAAELTPILKEAQTAAMNTVNLITKVMSDGAKAKQYQDGQITATGQAIPPPPPPPPAPIPPDAELVGTMSRLSPDGKNMIIYQQYTLPDGKAGVAELQRLPFTGTNTQTGLPEGQTRRNPAEPVIAGQAGTFMDMIGGTSEMPQSAPDVKGAPDFVERFVAGLVNGVVNGITLSANQRAAIPELQRQAIEAILKDERYNELLAEFNKNGTNRPTVGGQLREYYSQFVDQYVKANMPSVQRNVIAEPKAIKNN